LGDQDHAAEEAHLGAGARHTVDDAAGFILADGKAAPALDGLHPFRTVTTHSRQDNSHSEISVGFGN